VDFAFTFPYIATTHIKAFLNGVQTTAFTFFSTNVLRLASPPSNGTEVKIVRETPADTLAAVIQPGGPLSVAGLNSNFLQNLYYSQETQYDAANQSTAGLQAQITAATNTANTALAVANTQVTFTQSGTGAVGRTVTSKLSDIVNVKDFGAVGDGVTDDTAAIQAALNSSAVAICTPAGRYKITANLTRTGHTKLYGDGLGASIWQFTGNFGFVYSGGSGSDQYNMNHIAVEDMAFETTVKNTGALFDASWTTGGGGNTSKSISLRNVDFTAASASAGFVHGCRLTDARSCRIDNVRFLGDRDAAPIDSINGLTIIGSATGQPTEIFIDACQAYYVQNGLNVSGWVEGLYVDKSTFIACISGINANVTPLARPLLIVSSCHFATSTNGILNAGFVQTKIINNSIYSVGVDGFGGPIYAGIQIGNSGGKLDSLISGNDFQCLNDPGTTYGVLLTDTVGQLETLIIDANSLSAFDIGINIAPNVSNVKITDSNIFFGCTTNISNASSSSTNLIEFGSYAVGGSSRTLADGLIIKFGQAIVVTDANGDATINFGAAFPTTALSALVNNGDSGANPTAVFSVKTFSTSSLAVSLRPNPGVQTIRVNWIAFGN
jgi:hypothetical protein